MLGSRLHKTPLPSSNPLCILGPAPTSCENLYPENKLGNVSNCIPGPGPRRQRAPICASASTPGQGERGVNPEECKMLSQTQPRRNSSILQHSSKRTSA